MSASLTATEVLLAHRAALIEFHMKYITDNPDDYVVRDWHIARLKNMMSDTYIGQMDDSDRQVNFFQQKRVRKFLRANQKGFRLNLSLMKGGQ